MTLLIGTMEPEKSAEELVDFLKSINVETEIEKNVGFGLKEDGMIKVSCNKIRVPMLIYIGKVSRAFIDAHVWHNVANVGFNVSAFTVRVTNSPKVQDPYKGFPDIYDYIEKVIYLDRLKWETKGR